MNYKEFYDDVARDFGNDVALNAVIAVAIHLTTTVSDEDLAIEGSYSRRVTDLIRNQVDPKYIDLVLDIWAVVYYWEVQRELSGLDGAKTQSIAELLRKENECMIGE